MVLDFKSISRCFELVWETDTTQRTCGAFLGTVHVAYAECAGFSYGYTVTLPNGDPHRRGLVTACRTYCNVSEVDAYVYGYDADGRPVSRNGDVFGYDGRDQVTYAAISGNVFTHAYDGIGNHVLGGANAETNTVVANCLNQRVSVLGASV